MSFAGALGGFFGSLFSGYANEKAAEHQGRIQHEAAQSERQLTLDEAKQADREAFLRMGEMRAAAGASGSTAGSYSDVFADSAAQLTLRKQSIVYAGSVNVQRLETGAAISMAKAVYARSAGVGAASTELGKYYAGRNSNRAGTTLVNSGSGSGGSSYSGESVDYGNS